MMLRRSTINEEANAAKEFLTSRLQDGFTVSWSHLQNLAAVHFEFSYYPEGDRWSEKVLSIPVSYQAVYDQDRTIFDSIMNLYPAIFKGVT